MMRRSKVRIPVDGINLPYAIKERCPGSNPQPEGVTFRVQMGGPAGCGQCGTTHNILYGYLEDATEVTSYRPEHNRYRTPDYHGVLNHLLYGIYRDGWSLAQVKAQLEVDFSPDTFWYDPNRVRAKNP